MSNKNPLLKRRTLFNKSQKKKIYTKRKSISVNNLTIIDRINIKKEESPNRISNIIDFIKQKNRFFIENTFDAKGTREFLTSKEVAMRAIILNEETEEKNINKKESSISQQFNIISSSKSIKNHKSSKAIKKRTLSPKKSRKKAKRKNSEEKAIKKKENKKLKKSSKKMKDKVSSNIESNYDSKKKEKNIMINVQKNSNISDEDKIYKIYIDNENESDDNFQIKLEKEIRNFERMKNIKEIKVKNEDNKKFKIIRDLKD